MTDESDFSWMEAWLGAVLAGLLAFGFFFFQGATGVPTIVLGLILLLVMAGWAAWAWRKGDRDRATGVAVGYGLLTLMSGGQCTLFVAGEFDGPFSAATGASIYPLLLIFAVVTIGVVSAVNRFRTKKENKG